MTALLWPPEARAEALSLREAMVQGIRTNLELRALTLEIPLAEAGFAEQQGAFDTEVQARLNVVDEATPASTALAGSDTLETRSQQAEVALSRRFSQGLRSRLSASSQRSETSSDFEALSPQYRTAVVLELTQPLLRDYGTDAGRLAVNLSQNRLEQAHLERLEAVQQLGAQIEQAYLTLSLAQALEKHRGESVALARRLVAANRRRLEAGLIASTEVLQAETARAARQELLIGARQVREQALIQLADLVGTLPFATRAEELPADPFDAPESQSSPPQTQDPSQPQALAQALESRPEFKKQRLEIRRQKLRLAYAKNQGLPRLDLVASLGLNGLSGEASSGSLATPSSFEGGYGRSLNSAAEADGHSWQAGLIFSYPLGNRQGHARTRATRLEKHRALLNFKRLEQRIETQIAEALSAVNHGRERVLAAREGVDLAQQTLDAQTQRLEAGLSDTFQVLNDQEALVAAWIREATAHADLHRAQAALYLAMGRNLERQGILHDLDPQEIDDEDF